VTSDSTRSETLTTYDLSSECVFKLTGELSPHPITRQAHTQPFPQAPGPILSVIVSGGHTFKQSL